METYLIKSTAILAIFWTLYVIFLERENMHKFKRFYLLASIVAAVCIPLLTITQYVYVQPIDTSAFSNEIIPFEFIEPIVFEEPTFWNLELILWTIYSIGALIFSFRFLRNLTKIFRTIRANEKQKQTPITFVLLKQLINPHTFFNYIFLNKTKFEAKAFPQEVLLHEETHAKQKHSLDVLFIEILQIVFWFQPFIWLYKSRIKLNHEFLADQAVLDNGYQPSNYQKTLLSFSSNHQDYSLVNAINYSSIKKRFTVMKTQTSQKKKWLFSLLVLPILGLLFYSFSQREIIQIEENFETNTILLIQDNWDLSLNGIETSLETLLADFKNLKDSKKNELIIDSEKAIDIEFVHLIAEKLLVERVKISTTERTAVIDKDSILNKQYDEYKKQAPRALMNEYKAFMKAYKATNIIYGDSYERAIIIYDELMSAAQRASVQKYPARLIPKSNLSKKTPKKPTNKLLEDLKNTEKYAVWIDGKAIQNSVLENFSTEDFVHFWGSFVHKNARSKKFPQPNQYHLFTKKGFKSTYKDSQLKKYKKATEIYHKAIQDYLKVSQKSDYELRILRAKALNIYKTFSTEEIKKNDIKKPVPVPADSFGDKKTIQQKPPTAKEIAEYNTWAKKTKKELLKVEEERKKGNIIKYPIDNQQDLIKHQEIYSRMSDAQKRNATPNPLSDKSLHHVLYPKSSTKPNDKIKSYQNENKVYNNQQKTPTPKEVAEYNAWAKKLSNQINKALSNKNVDYPIIKQRDIQRYKSIYNRMTERQKTNAEAFPNIPTPPPPPPASKDKVTKSQFNAYNQWLKESSNENTPYKLRKEQVKYFTDIFNRMSEEQKKNVIGLPPPPPPPPAPVKVKKGKGGPSNYNIVFEDNSVEVSTDIKTRDYLTRYLILRASQSQTTPINYKLNQKKSDITEINTYIKNNRKADITFSSNTLHFFDKKNEEMTEQELQKVYKKLFVNYKNEGNTIVVKKMPEEKKEDCLELPKSFIIKNGNTLNIPCIEEHPDNKLRIFNRWGNLIYSKENYNNSWNGKVDKKFAKEGTDKPLSGTYYYVIESSKIDKQKAGYLYIEDKKTVSETTNSAVEDYKKKYKTYKILQDTPPHYINKSDSDKLKMKALFSDLAGMYFRLSKENKRLVERPIAPIRPYVKITLNGKTYYKKSKELTAEERATLPPPPPPIKRDN